MSIREDVGKYVYGQIQKLTSEMKFSGGRAKLARLRRGVGKVPGELPELWGIFLCDIPDELLSKNGVPTPAEWAIYLSLTLFAVHQQSNSDSVHAENKSIGKAAAGLLDEKTDEERERVLRRLGPILTAKAMPEFSHHLRCFVEILRAKNIRLDYVRLAKDIYDFQFEESRKKVQLLWAQDFYYNEKGE